ncbi:helix-turn-helix domain-containing protein [Streptomyces sp. NPDC006283]|uniref:helix-turn-helix domain-containing protein n=1 Tax=Streptomyces sp. NPDC006283 TaxID=3156741 RepID=UPI0033A56AA5
MGSPAQTQALERFYTTDDVAERYRTVAGTVRYWRHIGFGPKGVKVGRRYLYSETEIRRFDTELAAKAQAAKETA